MDFEKRVSQYVRLRDKIKAMEDEHSEKMKPFKDALEQLNGMMLHMLTTSGQESAKTAAGTVYRKVKKTASIADADAFRRHVIGNQDFDLLDWKANAPAVAKFVEENEVLPPGVNLNTKVDVGVRRGNEK